MPNCNTKTRQFDTKEYEIRQALVHRLKVVYDDDPEHKIVEELGINQAKVLP